MSICQNKKYIAFECVHIGDADEENPSAYAFADIDGYTKDETEEGTVICRVWLLRNGLFLTDWHYNGLFLTDWHYNGYRRDPAVLALVDSAKEVLKAYVKDQVDAMLKRAYETYKLNWMMDHGHSLSELIKALQVQMDEGAKDVDEAFRQIELHTGFGDEIYACESEFRDNEAYDGQLMKKLLSRADYQLWCETVILMNDSEI